MVSQPFATPLSPLEEYVRDPRNQDARAEDLICCTVRTGGADRIGVFVDTAPSTETPLWTSPHKVAMRRWLSVTSEGDRRLYQSLSDADGAAREAALPPTDRQIVLFTPARTKLEAKLQTCENAGIVLLQAFSKSVGRAT